LARAGIGTDPGGGGWISGGRLAALRLHQTRVALLLGLGREEEAHLTPSRQSIEPGCTSLLAERSNLVLSLPALGLVPGSKHAWSPRPALRRAQGCVVIAKVADQSVRPLGSG